MEPRAMKSSEKEEKFERGLRHFNARDFFEAHEVWEEIWLVEGEPEKTFLQGIIQIAAAFHHYQCGNTDGAESLLAAGIVKIIRFPANHRGLAIRDLREEAKLWARALGEMRRPGDERLPSIRRLNSSEASAESRAKVHTDKK
jgi:predicted metal-dependent hydrolase